METRLASLLVSGSFVLLFAQSAFAVWSGEGQITKVYAHNTTYLLRTTITDQVCTPGSFWWPIDGTDASQAMYAMAISAAIAGKRVAVVYDASNPLCQTGNSAKITHMYITQ